MAVLEPQLRKQLEQALAEIKTSIAASTKSQDLVETLLGRAQAAQPTAVGTDTRAILMTGDEWYRIFGAGRPICFSARFLLNYGKPWKFL